MVAPLLNKILHFIHQKTPRGE